MGASYRPDAALVGDARLCLTALEAAVSKRDANGAQQLVGNARKEKYAEFRELAKSTAMPIRPERVIDELQRQLPHDAVIVADPGTPCPYFSAYYEIRDTGRTFISNRAHGALGFALPAVVGAYYGRSGSKCVAVMGDGSFGMAVGELETIRRLDVPVTMIVFSNSVFGWIKAGQEAVTTGDITPSILLVPTMQRSLKLMGSNLDRDGTGPAAPALQAALELDKPTLVDIISQPLQEARAPVSEWVA